MAGVLLHNAHKENYRAKSERSFLFFKLLLGFSLGFEFGLGLMLGLELRFEFGLDLELGLGLG